MCTCYLESVVLVDSMLSYTVVVEFLTIVFWENTG